MTFDWLKIYQGNLDLPGIVIRVVQFLLIIAAIVAFLYFLYGGFMFITSQGDSEKVTNARNTLLYAVVGVIVIVLSYAIISWVGRTVSGL